MFPLCPYCGAAGWCPAEDARLHALRIQTAQRLAMQRWVLISVALVAVLVFALVISGVLK